MEAKQVSQLLRGPTHLPGFDAVCLEGKFKEKNYLADHRMLGIRHKWTIYSLPEDADIVRGFEKVEGGSGLLSMMVPECKYSCVIVKDRRA